MSKPTPDHALGPQNIALTVAKSFYDSANHICESFGFNIPQLLMFLAGLAVLLIIWSMVQGLRNRKSFSLEDDEDGDIHQSGSNVGSGVLRTESGT